MVGRGAARFRDGDRRELIEGRRCLRRGHCHIVPADRYVACLQPALIELEEGVARTPAERHSTPLRSSLPRVSYPPGSHPPILATPFDVKAGETISFLSTLRDSLFAVTLRDLRERQRALSFVENVVTGRAIAG